MKHIHGDIDRTTADGHHRRRFGSKRRVFVVDGPRLRQPVRSQENYLQKEGKEGKKLLFQDDVARQHAGAPGMLLL